jgi:hypothetical protein
MYRFNFKNNVCFGKYCKITNAFYYGKNESHVSYDKKYLASNCSNIVCVDIEESENVAIAIGVKYDVEFLVDECSQVDFADIKKSENVKKIIKEYQVLGNDKKDVSILMPRVHSPELLKNINHVTLVIDENVSMQYVGNGQVLSEIQFEDISGKVKQAIEETNSIKVMESRRCSTSEYSLISRCV